MRNSRGGLGDIPSPGKAGAPPASARSHRGTARELLTGLKGWPFRQRVIVASRSLTWIDFTPTCRGRHEIVAIGLVPYRLGRPATSTAGCPPVGGGYGRHVEMAASLISTGLLGIISN